MQKGFTLVEFIVILSIFAIMAAVALFNFTGFRSNVGINNLTHDIALTIRQAQVFGWATTSGTIDSGSDPVRRAQGVVFKNTNGAWERFFILYAKQNPGDQQYAYYDPTDTVADTIKIQGPNHIVDIRTALNRQDLIIDHVTNQLVSGSGSQPVNSDFSIVFSRPHPEALFFEGAAALNNQTANYVGIYIVSDATPTKLEHVVIISRLGEIEVQ